jgi:hypothetical protein
MFLPRHPIILSQLKKLIQVRRNHDFGTAVFGTAFGGGVVSARVEFGAAGGREAGGDLLFKKST